MFIYILIWISYTHKSCFLLHKICPSSALKLHYITHTDKHSVHTSPTCQTEGCRFGEHDRSCAGLVGANEYIVLAIYGEAHNPKHGCFAGRGEEVSDERCIRTVPHLQIREWSVLVCVFEGDLGSGLGHLKAVYISNSFDFIF
jgi:hypothetical protein